MTNDAIRPGCYELMVGSEPGIYSPLAPESTSSRPGKHSGERKENHRSRKAPEPPLHFPKVSLPQDSVGDSDENNSPASPFVHLFRRLLLFINKKKWQHPEEPTGNENGESIGRHNSHCSSAGALYFGCFAGA